MHAFAIRLLMRCYFSLPLLMLMPRRAASRCCCRYTREPCHYYYDITLMPLPLPLTLRCCHFAIYFIRHLPFTPITLMLRHFVLSFHIADIVSPAFLLTPLPSPIRRHAL